MLESATGVYRWNCTSITVYELQMWWCMPSIVLCSYNWFAVDSRIKICSWIWKSGLRLGLEEDGILTTSWLLSTFIYCCASKEKELTRAAASMDFVSSLISITEFLNKSHCSFYESRSAICFLSDCIKSLHKCSFTLNPFDDCIRGGTFCSACLYFSGFYFQKLIGLQRAKVNSFF